MPRVSVIIPAHNAAPFLRQTIESVHEQTYRDWEIIAVDDGSSDGTWELLQAGGPFVRSFRRERAGGPAVARNLALEHATGEFAVFLDADDLLLPRYIESQLACHRVAAGRQGGVGLVSCDAKILIDEQYAPYTHLQRIPDRHAPITLERVLRRNPIYGACLVPSTVGEAVGWFDPELFGTEDFGLWIKILEAGYRAVLNEEVLAVYRRTARQRLLESRKPSREQSPRLCAGARTRTLESASTARRAAGRPLQPRHGGGRVAALSRSARAEIESALAAQCAAARVGGARQSAYVAGLARATAQRAGQGCGRAACRAMNDDVTVVITCFNYGAFLRRERR